MNRTRKIGTCVAAAFTIAMGGSYLAEPAQAMEGCTLEELAAEITYVHEACRGAGNDGGTVHSCDEGGITYSCWKL